MCTYSNMLRPAPTKSYISSCTQNLSHWHSRSRLLNLTGFFSSVGGAPAIVELILWGSLVEDAGPDQGNRVLRRSRCECDVWEQKGGNERIKEGWNRCKLARAVTAVSERRRSIYDISGMVLNPEVGAVNPVAWQSPMPPGMSRTATPKLSEGTSSASGFKIRRECHQIEFRIHVRIVHAPCRVCQCIELTYC
jgi:hypothetical protein